eukprot:jgi/Tetstr1/458740/TSEL_045127.t1
MVRGFCVALLWIVGSVAVAAAEAAGRGAFPPGRHTQHIEEERRLSGGVLTPKAAASGFVVLAQTGATTAWSGFCDASSMDWRGWMPIHLARVLGRDRPLLVTDVRPLDGRAGRCRICFTGSLEEQANYFDCDDWLSRRSEKTTRFLIIAGTGDTTELGSPEHYPDVLDALSKPWVKDGETTVWHFPISRRDEIDRNEVFPQVFSDFRVMRDGAWVKPVQREALAEWVDWCAEQPRQNDLLYIARFHGWKGQLDFIENVDPHLLLNYTVHFYSSVNGSKKPGSIPVMIQQLAEARGISVVIHWKKQPQETVARHSCNAKGLIHYARVDANPRAVDESLINGMPVFVSRESMLPSALRSEPFVKMTSNPHNAGGSYHHSNLNRNLREFIARLDRDDIRESLHKFAMECLEPTSAYQKLFSDMGILARTNVET